MTITISPTIFRAYDIRGIVDDTLTAPVVYQLGLAIGTESRAAGESTVIVGRDGRISSPILIRELIEGLCASGCDVVDVGLVPTPVLYFATYTLPYRSGIMLTGSHNPGQYNGLKIIINGETLSDERIQGLYHRIINKDFSSGLGSITQLSVVDSYIDAVCSRFYLTRRLKVVVDCGNGVTGVIAPQLLKKLGCDLIELYTEIDGHFPNHHPDPGEAKNLVTLIDTVKREKADIGIAFDGDGDRIGVVTQTGEIIWPDRLLILFAKDLLTRHPAAEVIYDVKCSRHVEQVIKHLGGKPVMWRTGHSLIKAKMREHSAMLAGEMSGHVFFAEDWYGFDDALFAAALLLQILADSGLNSQALFDQLPNSFNTPELKIAVTEQEKFHLMETLIASANFPDSKLSTLDGLRVDFKDGFGLIRPSNTTPALVLRFEGDDEAALQRIQHQFRDLLRECNPALELPF